MRGGLIARKRSKQIFGLTLVELAVAVVFAIVALVGFGEGNIITDGQAELHIDALGFIKKLWYAWDPSLYLGFNSGFSHVYYCLYGFAYAALQAVHVADVPAQRLVITFLYLSIALAMLWGLAQVAPRMSITGRIAGSAAFLFNMYVAFNSNGSEPMLLAYASLPVLVGLCARVMDGRTSPWLGGLGVGCAELFASGINPPLLVINASVAVLYIAVRLYSGPSVREALSRLWRFALAAVVTSCALNLYWIVPFLAYFRSVWLGGVLDESPAMHNMDSSFANVLRGLGQWSIFQGNTYGPWYLWAPSYAAGLFEVLLWAVPIVAALAFAVRDKRDRALTTFFALVAVIAVPLVVGYYAQDGHAAITAWIYDILYRKLPGFQMFRSVYKWVMPYEYAIAGLFAVTVDAAVTRSARFKGTAALRRALQVCAGLLVILPIAAYWPVIHYKANKPMPPLPSWVYAERSFVAENRAYRVALFPTQYLEQFDWGAPTYYIENSTINMPMVAGYLGDLPSHGSDQWVKLAFREAGSGDRDAAWAFRLLGVDRILQRDDFLAGEDFSQSDRPGFAMTPTLSHQIVRDVLGARPAGFDGANRLYILDRSTPLVYGVDNPIVSAAPALAVPRLFSARELSQSTGVISPEGLPEDDLARVLRSFPVISAGRNAAAALAVESLSRESPSVHAGGGITAFSIARSGRYRVFAADIKADHLGGHACAPLGIDTAWLKTHARDGVWCDRGTVFFTRGQHQVLLPDGVPPDSLVTVFEPEDRWTRRLAFVQNHLPNPAIRRIDEVGTRLNASAGPRAIMRSKVLPDLGQHAVRLRIGRAGNAVDVDRLLFAQSTSKRPALTYLPGKGVYATSFQLMPDNVYEQKSTFSWSRGGPAAWYLLSADAHFQVALPSGQDQAVDVNAMIGVRARTAGLRIRVNGKTQGTFSVTGSEPLTASGRALALFPAQTEQRFRIRLRPGLNDVELELSGAPSVDLSQIPDALQRDHVGIAAIARPDLAFVCECTAQGFSRVPTARLAPIVVRHLALPYRSIFGDPTIQGIVPYWRQPFIYWLAVRFDRNGESLYRIVPLSALSDSASVSLGDLLPNTFDDAGTVARDSWIIATPQHKAAPPHPKGALPLQLNEYRQMQAIVAAKTGAAAFAKPRAGTLQWLTVLPPAAWRSSHFAVAYRRPVPTELSARVAAHKAATLLVLGESYDPRWVAMSAGKSLQHVLVDGYANGWIVPPSVSAQDLAISYTVQSEYVVSLALSIFSAVVLFAAYIVTLRRRKQWR